MANNWWGWHATDAWNQTAMGTAVGHWTSPNYGFSWIWGAEAESAGTTTSTCHGRIPDGAWPS